MSKKLKSQIPEDILERMYRAGGKNPAWYAGRTSSTTVDYKQVEKIYFKRKYTYQDLEFLPVGSQQRAKAIVYLIRKEKRKKQINKLLSIFKKL